MEELKLAFEVLAGWLLLCTFIGLMSYGLYLFLELWEMDRKNLLTIMAVSVGGAITGIFIAIIIAMVQ